MPSSGSPKKTMNSCSSSGVPRMTEMKPRARPDRIRLREMRASATPTASTRPTAKLIAVSGRVIRTTPVSIGHASSLSTCQFDERLRASVTSTSVAPPSTETSALKYFSEISARVPSAASASSAAFASASRSWSSCRKARTCSVSWPSATPAILTSSEPVLAR